MRLLTWNIQWGRGLDGRVDLGRIARTISGLGDFDVICLQEVAVNFPGLPGMAASGQPDQPAALAALFPGHVPVYGTATDVPDGTGSRKQFGNLILSRWPVGQVWRHLLPWPADPAVPSMQRVLVEAVVTSPAGVSLRILTTHLEYYSRAQRLAQIEGLRQLHAQSCRHALIPRQGKGEEGGSFQVFERPASALLCGDMNFPAEAEEYDCLLAPFEDGTLDWVDTWRVLHPHQANAPTVGVHPVDFVDHPSCFDFIFVTRDLASRVTATGVDPQTRASDHQPVWITLS